MSMTREEERFLSALGLDKTKANMVHSGHSHHSVVLTDKDTGSQRILIFRVQKKSSGDIQIKGSYTYVPAHPDPQAASHAIIDHRPFFKAVYSPDGQDFTLTSLRVEDTQFDIRQADIRHAARQFIGDYFKKIAYEQKGFNPVALLKNYNLKPEQQFADKAWPGLYRNGDLKASKLSDPKNSDQAPKKVSRKSLIMPHHILAPILGVTGEYYSHEPYAHRSLSFTDSKTQAIYTVSFDFERYKTKNGYKLTYHMSREKADGEKITAELCSADVKENKKNKHQGHVESLKYLGKAVDLNDQRSFAVFTKVMRHLGRMSRSDEQTILADLKNPPHQRRFLLPDEIMTDMGGYKYFNPTVQEKKIPQDGRTSFLAVGGANKDAYLSPSEKGIGANMNALRHEWLDDESGAYHQETIAVDGGVLFHDIFDNVMSDPNSFLSHKVNKKIKPDNLLNFWLITHLHADHISGLAYLVKAGYQLPPMIMNGMSKRSLQAQMKELRVEKQVQLGILESCLDIDVNRDVNPSNLNEVRTRKVGNQTVEIRTERAAHPDEVTRSLYFPRLRLGSFDIRVGIAPHSTDGLIFDAIQMIQSGPNKGKEGVSFRFTGDSTLRGVELEAFARSYKVDYVALESTGANRPGFNTSERDVIDSIAYLETLHKDQIGLYPIIGSNLRMIQTLVKGLAENDGKYLIIDGKALDDTGRAADKEHELIKWANYYGIEILYSSQKRAKDLILEGDPREVAVAITGTQAELWSRSSKLLQDSHAHYKLEAGKFFIAFLQSAIPTQNNAFIRSQIPEYAQKIHGVTVYLPEGQNTQAMRLPDGRPLQISMSGHPHQEEIKRFLKWCGSSTIFPNHGSDVQLQANVENAEKAGCKAALPHRDIWYGLDKKGGAQAYGVHQSAIVGIYDSNAQTSQFFLKGRPNIWRIALPVDLKPINDNKATPLKQELLRTMRALSGATPQILLSHFANAASSDRYNAHARGFLSHGIPFGIQRHHKAADIFALKHIFAAASFDTETHGFDPTLYPIQDISISFFNLKSRQPDQTVNIQRHLGNDNIPSPGAMLTTNTLPQNLEKGLAPSAFALKVKEAFKYLPELATMLAVSSVGEQEAKNHLNKALLIGHNLPFDARHVEQIAKENLIFRPSAKIHKPKGVIPMDTLQLSRALYAYGVKDYIVPTRVIKDDKTGEERTVPDHRLGSLCKANGIAFDEADAHGAEYDQQKTMELFYKQLDCAPALVGQMVMNADKPTGHLLADMMGTNIGFDEAHMHPVFSYISPVSSRRDAQMGCFLASFGSNDRYLAVLNLKYDPHKILSLPPKEIYKIMRDRKDDRIEIFDWTASPNIYPASFGFKANAHAGTSKESFDNRVSAARAFIGELDEDDNWQNLKQKLAGLYEEGRKIYQEDYLYEVQPNFRPARKDFEKKAPRLKEGLSHLMDIVYNLHDPINNRFYQDLKAYAKAVEAEDDAALSRQYAQLLSYRDSIGAPSGTGRNKRGQIEVNALDYVSHYHSLLIPSDIAPEDQKKLDILRRYEHTIQYHRACDEIREIEENPEVYARMIGDDPAKQALFEEIKTFVNHFDHLTVPDEPLANYLSGGLRAYIPGRNAIQQSPEFT